MQIKFYENSNPHITAYFCQSACGFQKLSRMSRSISAYAQLVSGGLLCNSDDVMPRPFGGVGAADALVRSRHWLPNMCVEATAGNSAGIYQNPAGKRDRILSNRLMAEESVHLPAIGGEDHGTVDPARWPCFYKIVPPPYRPPARAS